MQHCIRMPLWQFEFYMTVLFWVAAFIVRLSNMSSRPYMYCHLVVFKVVWVLSLRTSVQVRQNEREACSQNVGNVIKITKLKLTIATAKKKKKRLTYAAVLFLCLAESKDETLQWVNPSLQLQQVKEQCTSIGFLYTHISSKDTDNWCIIQHEAKRKGQQDGRHRKAD